MPVRTCSPNGSNLSARSLLSSDHIIGSPPSSPRIIQSDILPITWRLLMENHPHDSICGCSIDQVHDEMKVRFDQVDQIGEELTGKAWSTAGGQYSNGFRVWQIRCCDLQSDLKPAHRCGQRHLELPQIWTNLIWLTKPVLPSPIRPAALGIGKSLT